jgi:hypothetical protein
MSHVGLAGMYCSGVAVFLLRTLCVKGSHLILCSADNRWLLRYLAFTRILHEVQISHEMSHNVLEHTT